MTQGSPSTCRTLRALAVLCACLGLGDTASADDPWEFWPEAQLFVGLNTRTRVFLNAAYARGKDAGRGVAGHRRVSRHLLPAGGAAPAARLHGPGLATRPLLLGAVGVRPRLQGHRSRRRPVRGGGPGHPLALGQGSAARGRWLENRARVDLRWIGGEYSTRYRLRVEATREFTVAGHSIVPYFNVEWFYDTRYDGWARTLYTAGPEVTLNSTSGSSSTWHDRRTDSERVEARCVRRRGQGLLLRVGSSAPQNA